MTLRVEELARRCRQEAEEGQMNRVTDESFCLELFRRALIEQDQAAWQAVYRQYRSLVAYWVSRHSKFGATGEAADFFINAAFMRFWRGLAAQQSMIQVDGLSQLLLYLKSCVYSAIEDAYRRQQRQPPQEVAWHHLSEVLAAEAALADSKASGQSAEALEEAVMRRLQSRDEEVIATLSWFYGLRPREIQARHPELFPEVSRVYRIKRNILDRLLRDPEIQRLRQQ